MKDMTEHVCIGEPYVRIYYYCGRWRFDQRWGNVAIAIEYCPHCGKKLEPPAAKIEVNQKTLTAWHDDLQKVLVEVEDSYGSDAPLRVKRTIKGIQSALGYD